MFSVSSAGGQPASPRGRSAGPTIGAMTSNLAVDRRTLLRAGLAVGAGAAASLAVPPGALAAGTDRTATRAVPALVRGGRPTLPNGIQSGDVSLRGAVLWTRSDRPARMVVEVSRDPGFRHGVRRLRGPALTPRTDFTGRVRLRGLPRSADLYYRVRAVDLDDPRRSSEPLTGRLRTPGRHGDDVSFLWSADIVGQGWGINPAFGGFRAADAMLDLDPDFFLCSGDTVYSDNPLVESVPLPNGTTWRNVVTPEKSKVAETLSEFRGQFRYNLLADNWRDFLARTPQVNQWDDHEVHNNWYPGQLLEDVRYTEKDVDVLAARARRAWGEYVPTSPRVADPHGRIYRVIHYGPLLDVFVLDMRTNKDPNTPNRQALPHEGVLGDAQVAWLERGLRRSRALWKVLANDLPLGLVVPDGAVNQEGLAQGDPGAPLGREGEVARILSFLKRHGIRNHVWLTADVHYTAAHHYAPERASYRNFDPFWEFVSGPLNAGAFGPNTLDATFGPRAVFVETAPHPNTSPAEGSQFFGEVAIDGGSGRMTVRLRGIDGSVRYQTVLHAAPR
ncbi:MAG TPA: alkaline phosphatase D family protein [Actinomycetales bacterium]|nr:alkaline phosphatase D family protein [Actinomycetales bacterium]